MPGSYEQTRSFKNPFGTIRRGFALPLFSFVCLNLGEAGRVYNPVKQGLVEMISVYIDTILICTATAMMCLCSGLEPSADLVGAPYVQRALSMNIGSVGPYIVTFALLLFAFTTLLGNLYYCRGALNYIKGSPVSKKAKIRTSCQSRLTRTLIRITGTKSQ